MHCGIPSFLKLTIRGNGCLVVAHMDHLLERWFKFVTNRIDPGWNRKLISLHYYAVLVELISGQELAWGQAVNVKNIPLVNG